LKKCMVGADICRIRKVEKDPSETAVFGPPAKDKRPDPGIIIAHVPAIMYGRISDSI
jgi:hypothetical protein